MLLEMADMAREVWVLRLCRVIYAKLEGRSALEP